MNDTIAIVLGCVSCFILGMIVGMMNREHRIMEMADAMSKMLDATVEYVDSMKREYGIAERTENERKI